MSEHDQSLPNLGSAREPVIVMEGPRPGTFAAGYMNAGQTSYDIIATGTEEEMMTIARGKNYEGAA